MDVGPAGVSLSGVGMQQGTAGAVTGGADPEAACISFAAGVDEDACGMKTNALVIVPVTGGGLGVVLGPTE